MPLSALQGVALQQKRHLSEALKEEKHFWEREWLRSRLAGMERHGLSLELQAAM